MTTKKYYQNGKLTSVGFDTLEEVYAYQHNIGIKEIPSNEFKLEEPEKIRKLPDFLKWKEKIEKSDEK